MSDSVEHVHIQEIGIYDHYDVEPVIRGIMGFGQPPTYAAPIATGGAFVAFWGPMVRQLADKLGVDLDEVVGTADFAVHDQDLDTSVGVMEAGTVVARRVACEGRVGGACCHHCRAHHQDGRRGRAGLADVRRGG